MGTAPRSALGPMIHASTNPTSAIRTQSHGLAADPSIARTVAADLDVTPLCSSDGAGARLLPRRQPPSGSGSRSTAGAASGQARCQPTIGDGAGPFQANAIATPLRSKIGTGHVLLGRVLAAPDCAPVRRALVVLLAGRPERLRPARARRVLTDRQGRFRFEGPVPANYGRGPHIHIAVVHPAYEDLLTRYVVRPGSKTGRIRLVLTPLL